MATRLAARDEMLRPSVVTELERFQTPDSAASTYYLDLDPKRWGNPRAVRIALKDSLAEDRERLDQLEVRPAVRHALQRDWDLAEDLAEAAIGERHTRALACFLASERGVAYAVRLPWPVPHRAFFEGQFILWPLRQVLDQADRYGVILTDKDDARLFLFFLERLDEVAAVEDDFPGRVRVPNAH